MLPTTGDTIAAIATPPGEGGIAIVRISGKKAGDIALALSGRECFEPRRASLVRVLAADGSVLDEALLIWMPAPSSYTTEDVLEIQTHGGRAAANAVLRRALALGARPAEPGEFTLRAYLNGRIDLLQAEAVSDIIMAAGDEALRVHESLLGGLLSREIDRWQHVLVEVLSTLEVLLDFPEEELSTIDLGSLMTKLDVLRTSMEEKLETHLFGRSAREGYRIAILGAPNVGKSKLFNDLLDEERAIVSPHAGTTRDAIDARVNLAGVHVLLVDTAGLRSTSDSVESEGIARARKAAAGSDLVIYVFDASRELGLEELAELEVLNNSRIPLLPVVNKMDLAGESLPEAIPSDAFRVSALRGDGIDALAGEIKARALSGGGPERGCALTRERHRAKVEEACNHVREAVALLEGGIMLDAAASELQHAMTSLRELLGWGVPEDVLEKIFNEFCIGK